MGRYQVHIVVSLFSFILLTNFSFQLVLFSDTSTLTPSPQSSESNPKESTAFKPSIAVILGVLTLIFSITFLLLLYAKHCRRGDNNAFSISNSRSYPPITPRKNSGVNRAVIESLPIFRFASLKGQKDGLECAVCLNKFEPTEVLRLLPKCKHAFHVECVDTWLDEHCTCPLCRCRVDPEDILLVEEDNRNASGIPSTPREVGGVSRVSGRHSFAGNSLEVIAERTSNDTTTFIPRRSLDSWSFFSTKKKRNGESVGASCFDHQPRKDGLLLAAEKTNVAGSEQRRLEHRIIVSRAPGSENHMTLNHRWSDVQPSGLLLLQSEIILSDSRQFLRGWRRDGDGRACGGEGGNGGGNNESRRAVVKERSMSEITGLPRFRSNE